MRSKGNAVKLHRFVLVTSAAVAFVLVVFGSRLDARETSSDERIAPVLQAYYNVRLAEHERIRLAEERLAALVRSADREDRMAAALANAELSSVLGKNVIVTNFQKLVADQDRDLRELVLFSCATCTGYSGGFVHQFLSPHIQRLNNDPDPQIRRIARGAYFSSRKTRPKLQ